jgi:DNA-binding transcriptional LysR family regulator
MPDRLIDIQAFVRAVEAKSFTLAGERLGVSRSAVGKSVARLEEALGVRLLHRTTRSISLSEEGAAYYEHCLRALQALQEGELVASHQGREPVGTLRLEVPVAFGRRHVVPLIADFLKQWPSVNVNASFSDRFVDLVAEGIDLCIRIGGEEDSRLVSWVLAQNRLIVCASPEYLATRKAPRTPEQLQDHECITFGSGEKALDWRFKDGTREWRQSVTGRLRLGNAESVRDAALAGVGLAQLDAYIVGDDIRSGRLVPLLTELSTNGPPIRAVYPHRRYAPPKVRVFLDAAAKALRNAQWD